MSIYNPPNTFFNGINFNNDFYAIPNNPNSSGISLSFANSHYLLSSSGAAATSSATTTQFSGSVGIGTAATGTAGTLVVQGNINTYLGNFLENGIPLNMKYQYNLQATEIFQIRQYPLVSLTSGSTNLTGQAYGNGYYIASASTYYPSQDPYKAFIYPFNTANVWNTNTPYTYTTVITGSLYGYAGSTSTTVSGIGAILGEWIQLSFPVLFVMTSYSVTGATSGFQVRSPVTWYLVGSLDAITWYPVDYRTGVNNWSSTINTTNTYVPNGANSIYAYGYYRIIVTQTFGSAALMIGQITFNGNETTVSAAAINTNGVGIGTNTLTYPTSFSVATGNSYFANSVGIGTTASGTIGDLKSLSLTTNNITTNNINNSNVIWSPTYYINQPGTSVLSLTSFVGQYSTSSIIGDTVLTSAPSQSLILQSGVSGGAAIYINSANKVGISTSTLNTGATLDVGGVTNSTLYTYLNGLRISGVDANTIYQSIAGSNIGLTTASTSSYIIFSIGNGNVVSQISPNGITMGFSKGIGIGAAAPASNQISITAATSTAGALINGSNARIGLNNDSIYLGYASTNGNYSSSALIGDFILRNTTGQVIIQSSNGTYPNMLINGSGTLLVNPTNGATCSYFDIAGNLIIYNTLNVSNGITTGGSINVTGGTPSTFGPLTAAIGTISGNNVTVAPFGYLWWGGGNGSTVISESVPGSTSYSIKCQYALIAAGLISNSDKRIKRDIINIDNSLEIIEKIEPKNYNLIETAQNKYGFIAQDVKKIAPSVVNMSHEYIPLSLIHI